MTAQPVPAAPPQPVVPATGRRGRFLGFSLLIGGLALPIGALLVVIAPVGLFILAMVVMGENTDGGIGDEKVSPTIGGIVIVAAVLAIALVLLGLVMDLVSLVLATSEAFTRPDARTFPILALLATAGALALPLLLVVSAFMSESAPELGGLVGTGGIVGAIALRIAQVVLGVIRLIAGRRR